MNPELFRKAANFSARLESGEKNYSEMGDMDLRIREFLTRHAPEEPFLLHVRGQSQP